MICAVIGDSIGEGVSWHLPQCVAYVRKGISSNIFYREFEGALGAPRDLVVISLGANDTGFADQSYLWRVRDSIRSKKVIWIVPANNKHAAAVIHRLASQYHDDVIDLKNLPLSPDHIHPTWQSYHVIAREIKMSIGDEQ